MLDKITSLPLLFLSLNVIWYELLRRHILWKLVDVLPCSNVCGIFFILSAVIIYNTGNNNWAFLDTSRKYLNNAWLLVGFKVGVGNLSISRVNMISLPTTATLCIILVLSIWGAVPRELRCLCVLEKYVMTTTILSWNSLCFIQ